MLKGTLQNIYIFLISYYYNGLHGTALLFLHVTDVMIYNYKS
jgi:hypothetical protein